MKIQQYLPAATSVTYRLPGVPERHEPNVGELNYQYLFAVLDERLHGWVGCEYRPGAGLQPGGTSSGLAWLRPYQ